MNWKWPIRLTISFFAVIALLFLCIYLSCKFNNEYVRVEFVNLVVCLASAVTILSIILAVWALHSNREVLEAGFLSQYNDKYFSSTMLVSLRCLYAFRDSNSNSFPKDVYRAKDKNPKGDLSKCGFNKDANFKWPERVDLARREVKRYFLSIWELYENGFISRGILKNLCNKDGIVAYFNIVEPLEYYLKDTYDNDKFHKMMKQIGGIYEEKVKSAVLHDKGEKRVITDSEYDKTRIALRCQKGIKRRSF